MINKQLKGLSLLFIIYMSFVLFVTACDGGEEPQETPTDASAPTDAPVPTYAPQGHSGEVLKEIFENTRPGQVTFNVPLKMKIDDASLVELLISDDLQRNLQKELFDNKGKVETARLQVSSTLRARLEGINFNIKSLNEENRLLIKNGVATWRWSVIPTEGGEQNLYLSIYARVRKNNSDENIDLKTFQREINVLASPTGWFKQNWKWVIENSTGIGAILAGIFVFVLTKWRWVKVKFKNMKKKSSK
jgi:hypothetical protein